MSTATGTLSSLWESGYKRRRWGLGEKTLSLIKLWLYLQTLSFCTGSRTVWDRHANADQSHQGQGSNCYVFNNQFYM